MTVQIGPYKAVLSDRGVVVDDYNNSWQTFEGTPLDCLGFLIDRRPRRISANPSGTVGAVAQAYRRVAAMG